MNTHSSSNPDGTSFFSCSGTIQRVNQLNRGYEKLEERLASVGARITRIDADGE